MQPAEAVGECPACLRLEMDESGSVGRCPACGARLRSEADLPDLAVPRAAAQGANVANVEIFSGEAAAQLLERGGIGAWIRS